MTMSELAKLAGVSESTVSRALTNNTLIAEATRSRIQQIARETGFAVNPVASSLRSRRSNIVSVLITLVHERNQHVSDPFMMAMLAHIADALSEAGYDMLLSKVSVHEDAWIEQIFRARRPAGALLIGQSFEHAAIERAAQAGLPLVVWGARLPRQSYVTVGTDNAQGGQLATSHLIQAGCRRIVFLGEPSLPEVSLRLKGYHAAHKQAGLPEIPGLIVPCGFDPAAAAAAAEALVGGPIQFDGIVASSDVIAMTAVRALHSAGRQVPADVAVVGFDDVEMAAYVTPSITTIRQNLAGGARLLVKTLIELMAGQTVKSIVLPAELVVRETSRRG
jgi:DNA-binding LacI/PurR family transcriptional regulator